MQDPVVLNNNSEPEPDIAVCLPVPDKYKSAHPTADQVLLVIEVAESSLTHDRTRKARAYAASGVPEYWIANLIDRQIEVLTDCTTSRNYRQRRIVKPDEELTLPGGSIISVSAILPNIMFRKEVGSCNQSVHSVVKVDNDFSHNRATR